MKRNNQMHENDWDAHFWAPEIQSETGLTQALFLVFFIWHIFPARDCLPSSHIASSHTLFCHIFSDFKKRKKKSHRGWDTVGFPPSLLCFGLTTSIKFSNCTRQNFKCVSEEFWQPQNNPDVSREHKPEIEWKRLIGIALAIFHNILSISVKFSGTVWSACSFYSLKSQPYPQRSWWAPEGAAAWWKRTPAPRCPPSAALQSPKWRSAWLRPRPTPRHHNPTRTRSPSRPPRRLDRRQDQRSQPAPHSSSLAPTPARHRPTSKGRAPPGTRLLPACSQNPVWVRSAKGETEPKKCWLQVFEELGIIKRMFLISKEVTRCRKAGSKEEKSPKKADFNALYSFFFTSCHKRGAMETLLFSDSLWLALKRSDCLTAK